jgi:hypothetical protein
MSQLPIDIDAEAVYFDGHWYTRDDLARRIKAMLDSGDFAVTRPGAALEQLTAVVSSIRTLAFRATPDMVEAINTGASRAGKSVGAFIRDALSQQLGLPSSDFGPARPLSNEGTTPVGKRQTDPEVPQQGQAQQAQQPQQPQQQGTPIAGPGAIRAAQNDRLPSVVVEPNLVVTEAPVELTNKKPATKEEEAAAERRWFNS